MSLQFADSFDLYNGTGANTGLGAKWAAGTNEVASMVTGRFGGQAMRLAVGTSTPRTRPFTAAAASFACGFAYRVNSWPTVAIAGGILYFNSGTTYMVSLTVTNAGEIVVSRNTSITAKTTLGTSAGGVFALNTWHFIEVEVTISDTVGVFKVYVDGVAVLTLTGQDTRNGTPTTCDTVQLGQNASNTNSGSMDFDDFYLTNTATRLGECKVEPLRPTSDVAQGFARSTGSTNYTLVDDTTANGDTDYVQGSTVGTVDTYGLGDLSSTPSSILAVQLTSFAMKTDAASRSIALQAKSGATTSDGPNFALAASYGKQERILETDPNTGAAWTAAAVNALQAGPKVTV